MIRRDVRDDPHSAYRPDRDFIITDVHPCIGAATMKVLDIETQSSDPVAVPIPHKLDEHVYSRKPDLLSQKFFVFKMPWCPVCAR